MDICPREILLQIFTLACTDGGTTGCVLSLVSKYIRDVSSTVQLQSVHLDGAARMRLFVDTLHARPPTLRHVKHLLLSDRRSQHRDNDSGHFKAYTAILTLVGPQLVSLGVCLRQYIPFNAFTPPGVDLSRLRDLVTVCPGFGGPQAWQPVAPNLRPSSLPAVTRLHLYGMSPLVDNSAVTLFSDVARAAPGLIYLRLSAFYEMHQLPDVLAEALFPGTPHRLPLSLRQVIVQPLNVNYADDCGFCRDEHIGMKEDLERLATSITRVTVGPNCSYLDEDCLEGWLDATEGGDGCWRMTPRVSSSTMRWRKVTAERRTQRVQEGKGDYESDDGWSSVFPNGCCGRLYI